MSLKEELENVVSERVAQLLAEKVMEQVNAQLEEKWGTVTEELVAHRKTVKELTEKVSKQETTLEAISCYIEVAHGQAKENAKQQKKASKLLDEALKELNIQE